jgi:hypothetical protein
MDPSRRQIVQLLAGLGVTAGSLEPVDAQMRARLTTGDLKGAQAVQDTALPDDQVEIVRRALQQALDEFAPVRALDLDDAVGLPIVFRPERGR